MSDSSRKFTKSHRKNAVRFAKASVTPNAAEVIATTKLTESEARRKARKAYDNSKYKCGKPGPYQNTKFLFPSFNSMISAVGLPSRKNVSLDRIDVNGHYERGNVRWATAAVQAANKRRSTAGSVPTLSDFSKQAEMFRTGEACRTATANTWMQAVSFYNGRCSTAVLKEALSASGTCDITLLSSFNARHVFDYALEPGVFAMPSLTDPGRAICLTGGPFHDLADAGDRGLGQKLRVATQRGFIRALGYLKLDANIARRDIDLLASYVNGSTANGICWIGRPDPSSLRAGWIEGMMLCAAARFSYRLQLCAAVLPAIRVLEDLPDKPWIDPLQGYLGADYLFVPDFQVDAGLGWQTRPDELRRLVRLLAQRCDAGLKTFVGLQNLNKIPEDVRRVLLSLLDAREFDATDMPPKPTIAEVHERARKVRTRLKAEGASPGPAYS